MHPARPPGATPNPIPIPTPASSLLRSLDAQWCEAESLAQHICVACRQASGSRVQPTGCQPRSDGRGSKDCCRKGIDASTEAGSHRICRTEPRRGHRPRALNRMRALSMPPPIAPKPSPPTAPQGAAHPSRSIRAPARAWPGSLPGRPRARARSLPRSEPAPSAAPPAALPHRLRPPTPKTQTPPAAPPLCRQGAGRVGASVLRREQWQGTPSLRGEQKPAPAAHVTPRVAPCCAAHACMHACPAHFASRSISFTSSTPPVARMHSTKQAHMKSAGTAQGGGRTQGRSCVRLGSGASTPVLFV